MYRGVNLARLLKIDTPKRDMCEIQQGIANKKTAIDSGFLFSRCSSSDR